MNKPVAHESVIGHRSPVFDRFWVGIDKSDDDDPLDVDEECCQLRLDPNGKVYAAHQNRHISDLVSVYMSFDEFSKKFREFVRALKQEEKKDKR